MLQMNMPKRFWSQGVMSTAYLINRLPSMVLNFMSPMEMIKGRKVNLTHLKVFVCICFFHVQSLYRDKMYARVAKCILFGNSST